MRKAAKTKNPAKRLYTVTIDYPDGTQVEDRDVEKIETDWWLDNQQQMMITYHDRSGPSNYALIDGVKIGLTVQNVEEP